MIIGISGKAGSGKDLIAKIIMLYFNGYSIRETIQILNTNTPLKELDWQIKKFATPVKQIVAILTNKTEEEVNKDSFKHEVIKLKAWNSPISNYSVTAKLHRIALGLKQPATGRKLFQIIGTDIFRYIDKDIWVELLFDSYKKNQKGNLPNWIITDVRFINEVKAIKEKEGIVIKVIRDNINKMNHKSETALDKFNNFDEIISNNGTIEDLVYSVRAFLLNYFKDNTR